MSKQQFQNSTTSSEHWCSSNELFSVLFTHSDSFCRMIGDSRRCALELWWNLTKNKKIWSKKMEKNFEDQNIKFSASSFCNSLVMLAGVFRKNDIIQQACSAGLAYIMLGFNFTSRWFCSGHQSLTRGYATRSLGSNSRKSSNTDQDYGRTIRLSNPLRMLIGSGISSRTRPISPVHLCTKNFHVLAGRWQPTHDGVPEYPSWGECLCWNYDTLWNYQSVLSQTTVELQGIGLKDT